MKNKFAWYLFMFFVLSSNNVFAVPETVGTKVVDVTPNSFSVIWMTDVTADPRIEVFTDSQMNNEITSQLKVVPMGVVNEDVLLSARSKGIMKVTISGLQNNTVYYARAVTVDPFNSASMSYSPLVNVTTADRVRPFNEITRESFSNDVLTFNVFTAPSQNATIAALGDLLVLEFDNSIYPISSFVGSDSFSPEGVLDLNNIFSSSGTTLDTLGGEIVKLTVYKSGTFSTLYHYRKLPVEGSYINAREPVRGYLTDINLDGDVNEYDFADFKNQYRKNDEDEGYNPDFNFIDVDTDQKIDVKDFGRFAVDYGRTGVE